MMALLSTLLFTIAALAAGTAMLVTVRDYAPDMMKLRAQVHLGSVERFVSWRILPGPVEALLDGDWLPSNVSALRPAPLVNALALPARVPTRQSLAA